MPPADVTRGRSPRSFPQLNAMMATAVAVDRAAPPAGGRPLELRLLGPVQVWSDGAQIGLGVRKERLLVAVLALEVNRMVPTDRLIDVLWPERPPRSARASLQTSVHRVRAVLSRSGAGDGVELVTDSPGYRLVADPERIDSHRFTNLVRQADTAAARQRIALLDTALGLWRGVPLADVADDAVRDRLCRHLAQLRLTALEDRITARLECGENRALIGELSGLVAKNPLHERFVGLFMTALHGAGRTAEALRVYHDCRRRLAVELGLDPSRELQALHQAILDCTPRAVPAPVVPAPRAACEQPSAVAFGGGWPATGLLPADLPVFCGRTRELAALDAAAAMVVAISGTAGVGKRTLAVHWAHRAADRFPDGQLYLDLRGFGPGEPMTAEDAAQALLAMLAVPTGHLRGNAGARAAVLRGALSGRRVLMLLDNVRDAEQVRPLLPDNPGCLTLVTGRAPLASLAVRDGARLLGLAPPPLADAVELFVRRLGPRTTDVGLVKEIVERSARLPLALAIVAARAADNPTFPLRALVQELRDSRGRLDGWRSEDPGTDLRTVFSWSYRLVGPRAAELFRRYGRCSAADISASAAARLVGVSPRQARRLLAELAAAQLLTEHVPGRYTTHALLRAYASELP